MDTKDAIVETLLRDYTEAAARHGGASRGGDHESANQQYEIMANLCREFRARGRDAQVRLLDLLDNPDPYVRLWASSHSLEFAPDVAESVLERLSDSVGLVAFDAEMTLREGRKGTLRFP